jgi:hypothetical protein
MPKAWFVEEDGTRRELSGAELEELGASLDEEKRQRVVMKDPDGNEFRPFRFVSNEPPSFSDDGKTVII